MMVWDGQAIFNNFTTGDLAPLAGSAELATIIANSYETRANVLTDLLVKMDWDGAAANATHRGVTPLAVEHQFASGRLATVREAIQRQIEAFLTAKNAVVPIPPVPNVSGSANAAERAYNDYHAANQHNVDVMTRYEAATRENQDMLAKALANLNSDPPPPPGPPAPPQPGPYPAPPAGGQRPPGGGTGPASRPPDAGDTAVHPTPVAPDLSTGHGRTDPEFAGPRPPGPGRPDPGLPRPGDLGSGHDGTWAGQPFGPVGGLSSGSDPRRAGGSPGAARGFESGAPRGTSEPGPRTGARGGFGGTGAAEAAAARSGRGGAGGLGGGPLGAGGRGQGGEDTEHERLWFLVEPDPEGTFGPDEIVAPPVIGE